MAKDLIVVEQEFDTHANYVADYLIREYNLPAEAKEVIVSLFKHNFTKVCEDSFDRGVEVGIAVGYKKAQDEKITVVDASPAFEGLTNKIPQERIN